MSETVTIRAARPEDAARIARIGVETWRDAYAGLVPDDYLLNLNEARQAVQWEAAPRRARGSQAVLVAEILGPQAPKVIGFGSCGRSRTGPMRGEVYTLYVSTDWQNQGFGRSLMSALFEILAGHGVNDAVIWVLSGNPARFFYESMGGTRLAERKERFAGTHLEETAYGWPDLKAWLAERGRRV